MHLFNKGENRENLSVQLLTVFSGYLNLIINKGQHFLANGLRYDLTPPHLVCNVFEPVWTAATATLPTTTNDDWRGTATAMPRMAGSSAAGVSSDAQQPAWVSSYYEVRVKTYGYVLHPSAHVLRSAFYTSTWIRHNKLVSYTEIKDNNV